MQGAMDAAVPCPDWGAVKPPRVHPNPEALRRVRSQAFAREGLVEEWDTSVCLLHASLGRGTQPIAAELRQLGRSRNSRGCTRAVAPAALVGQ